MGIKYFYDFCIASVDDTDLESDILSAVRRSYFATFERIRDRITYDSEGSPLLYDYCIEKDRPMRWTVKTLDGTAVQEVLPAEDGRYYLCFYRDGALYKRLLFSRLHTLLKAEYMGENGAVNRSIEPRRVQGGLCLLYTGDDADEPVVLSDGPRFDAMDPLLADRVRADFHDYTAAASTNEGVVWFLSDAQSAHLREFIASAEQELEEKEEEGFLDGDAPLYEKINAKDFNVKRNLSSALDISMAKEFGSAAAEETAEPAQPDDAVPEPLTEEADIPEIPAPEEKADEAEPAVKPDKLIMADGAVYSYYGELDAGGNRSGYGRTLTDLGRTAYEGMYRGDKRSGKGAYFYKDGTLCYSGDWSENVRHGVGVGVSSRDGSMHVGRWVNNKPEGSGVRMTAEGEIRFVCKELSDGGTVLMNYLPDDTVQISRYDKDGKKISEKTVSLTDEKC